MSFLLPVMEIQFNQTPDKRVSLSPDQVRCGSGLAEVTSSVLVSLHPSVYSSRLAPSQTGGPSPHTDKMPAGAEKSSRGRGERCS